MKRMNSRITFPQTLIIGAVGFIFLALLYFMVIYRPVSEGIANANAERDTLQIEYNAIQTKLLNLKTMQNELEEIHLSGDSPGRIESYNNSKNEIDYLNESLADTNTYSVKFSEITRNQNLIRRVVDIQYTVSEYQQAKTVLSMLVNCPYRLLLTDIRVTGDKHSEDLMSGGVNVNLKLTFFETLEDGKADKGLPPDVAEDSQ